MLVFLVSCGEQIGWTGKRLSNCPCVRTYLSVSYNSISLSTVLLLQYYKYLGEVEKERHNLVSSARGYQASFLISYFMFLKKFFIDS